MSPSLSTTPRKESEIQRSILAFLATVPGVTAWRCNTGAVQAVHKGISRFVRFGFPGLPDIVGWYSERLDAWRADRFAPSGQVARFLGIEVKRPGQPLSPHQQAFGDLVRSSGGLFIHATCVQDVVDAFAQARGR